MKLRICTKALKTIDKKGLQVGGLAGGRALRRALVRVATRHGRPLWRDRPAAERGSARAPPG